MRAPGIKTGTGIGLLPRVDDVGTTGYSEYRSVRNVCAQQAPGLRRRPMCSSTCVMAAGMRTAPARRSWRLWSGESGSRVNICNMKHSHWFRHPCMCQRSNRCVMGHSWDKASAIGRAVILMDKSLPGLLRCLLQAQPTVHGRQRGFL